MCRLVQKFFSFVATSVPSERLFSSAGNVIIEKQNCLTPELADQLIFLFENSQKWFACVLLLTSHHADCISFSIVIVCHDIWYIMIYNSMTHDIKFSILWQHYNANGINFQICVTFCTTHKFCQPALLWFSTGKLPTACKEPWIWVSYHQSK